AVAIDHAKALLAGKSPAGAALATDNNLNAPAAPTESDQQLLAGTRAYEGRLVQLATAADTLDRAWDRYLSVGFRGTVNGSFERGWFALWQADAVQGAPVPGYEHYWDQLRSNAEILKERSLAADEAARQAGVLPGVRRELRQKYKLDLPGF